MPVLDEARVRVRHPLRYGIVLAAVVSWSGTPRAETVVVGPSDGTCPTAIFNRIQSAIDAAVPGTTISVCSGIYAEQLLITKRVRLVGSSGTRLVPPPLAVQATSLHTGRGVAAAITLRAPATIDGVAIDAGGNGITTCDGSEPLLAGIYARGVAATIVGTSVVGARIAAAPPGCANGVAIFVQGGGAGPRIRIEGNSVAHYQRAGIVVQDPDVRAIVRENVVEGDGDTPDRAQTGIEISNEAGGRVESNVVRNHATPSGVVCDADAGIVLDAPRIRVRGNQLQANAVGIRAESRGHVIQGNAIDGGTVGLIGLSLDADESRVQSNTIANQAIAAIRITGSRCRLRANTLSGVHEAPGCDALRDDPACAALTARCGAGVWLLGRANAVIGNTITDVDTPVIDEGRGNTVR